MEKFVGGLRMPTFVEKVVSTVVQTRFAVVGYNTGYSGKKSDSNCCGLHVWRTEGAERGFVVGWLDSICRTEK